MSIIRQRKQKMILAWFMGAVTAGLIVGGLMLFSILDMSSLFGFIKVGQPETIEKVPQIVASRFIEAKTVLTEEDLMVIMVPVEQEVVSVTSKEALIGKEVMMDVHKALPITKPMVETALLENNQQRVFEFDFVKLPFNLEIGDVVDVRIVFPNGQDYVVLSKKEVLQFERQAEDVHRGLLNLQVDEDEVLRMSSALVDKILTETAELYLVKYVDPTFQTAAEISYPVNRSVLSVLKQNPNLIETPDMTLLSNNRYLLDMALKELLDEDDEWFSIFTNEDGESNSDNDSGQTSAVEETSKADETSSADQTSKADQTSTKDETSKADQASKEDQTTTEQTKTVESVVGF